MSGWSVKKVSRSPSGWTALQIPFAFVTGYGAEGKFPAAFADKPRLAKPCSTDALEAVLKQRSIGDARDAAI